MRSIFTWLLACLGITSLLTSCVDPEDITLVGTVNVVVVDGTITDLAEPQIIRLNRSRADSVTGRFGTLPITKASVEVVMDSSQVIACHETVAGSYQLPSDFKGQVGHAYQLRFTLSDGTRYQSTQQVMQTVPPITRATAQFNPTAISPPFSDNLYTAGHDLFIDFTDPVETTNYYRWEWKLYEQQSWCRTCYESIYTVNQLDPLPPNTYFPYYYSVSTQPYEDCFHPPSGTAPYVSLQNNRFDYPCRTQCWELIYSHYINVFSDQFTNGGIIVKKSVGQIPLYQSSPCLVDIRQESITKDAYQYYNLFQQQTQNTGSIVDTPPTALAGNIHNQANRSEVVVGYFTASSVAVFPYYLPRNDISKGAKSPGLFYALNGRLPMPEGRSFTTFIMNGPARPPTAICGPLDQRTPYKPVGWPN
ncbi:DUF4249 family protein [Spirosoma sp. HMF4905]|uniref:DUF4249 family protein n=1 Tax=Spirosoma arboris TaxID=2682092 RepID=A0A7K1S553_9BACT|nr:DUF4249 domain-containing protein [Spirosoma arboris]MVM28952.1 DUF4249 family protein [Spirosoma arboris]